MEAIRKVLYENYHINYDTLELIRDMGSTSYAVFSGGNKYFLRVIKSALFDTATTGAEIQAFLQNLGFPVPPIIFNNENSPYTKTDDVLIILYEFIEGTDANPEQDAEAIGALVGRLHQTMKTYPGKLVKRDKHFFIGRYIDILQKRQYARISEYIKHGDILWERIKGLQCGYCHGDMYEGNIRKALDGTLYIHDFDTSCEGFPMYDTTLICDRTKYFEFDERNYDKSCKVLARFVPEYGKYSAINQSEIAAFPALIAIQHFSTQATVMDLFGINCLSDEDIDNQLDWLNRWHEQWHNMNTPH
jgi:Ser/Thr protein kinase RdoA (MazF antagonist)